MRRTPRSLLAAAFGLAGLAAVGGGCMAESPYGEPTPDAGPCDVIVDEVNSGAAFGMINDPSKRVFCVGPGDYRAPRFQSFASSLRRRRSSSVANSSGPPVAGRRIAKGSATSVGAPAPARGMPVSASG